MARYRITRAGSSVECFRWAPSPADAAKRAARVLFPNLARSRAFEVTPMVSAAPSLWKVFQVERRRPASARVWARQGVAVEAEVFGRVTVEPAPPEVAR
jgi:hypothetical protein